MRLVHLTDPHLTTPPHWRTLVGRSHHGKRFLGYASWARKRRQTLRRQWLDELVAQLDGLAADQLLISGDLTQLGSAEEIVQARGWLESVAAADRITFVPGNHDTYARESWNLLRQHWSEYLHLPEGHVHPVTRSFGDVVVVGLSSAVSTRPFSACGVLGSDQLEQLAAELQRHADAFKILMLHHPPLPGMIKFRKRLRDAAALGSVLDSNRVNLVLHGHRHRNLSYSQESIRKFVSNAPRVFCTAPASSEGASFRVFDVESEGEGWRVEATLRQRTSAGFVVAESESWRVSAPG
jgi:3',5'-cyclic AMP phosphodiesterase CpdA